MENIVTYEYNGLPISFENGNTKMVNATEMAKVFGKFAKDWLVNKNTKEFLDELSAVRRIPLTELVTISQGGVNQGTWMHEDVAIEFARWLSPKFAIWCNDRIKELAKYGMTATQTTIDNILNNPDFGIQLLQTLKEEREAKVMLERENKAKSEQILLMQDTIKTMEKKVSYLDHIFACPSTVKVKVIAQDYGMSAIAFNQLLHSMGIQYRDGKNWILYRRYIDKGYVKDVPFEYDRKDGTKAVKSNTQWTQKGRAFLYEFLKSNLILPLIEQ